MLGADDAAAAADAAAAGLNPEVVRLAAAHKHAMAGHRPCPVCGGDQPARAHHCRTCNQCVATFDHHCRCASEREGQGAIVEALLSSTPLPLRISPRTSVLGTCVGERNRCRFWAYLGAQAAALAVALSILTSALVWRRETGDWVSVNIISLAFLVTLWPLQAVVVGLFGFHSWLGEWSDSVQTSSALGAG
jgi:palmitoyltransferase